MRVISGIRRGLKLVAPTGDGTRPTSDRVKESLFNIIMPYIPAKNVLDLFGGSGALGIEALSRGSERCVFCDNDVKAIEIINFNLEKAKLKEKSKVLKTDALSYLSGANERFDVIFLDPPYNKGFLNKIFDTILKNKLLAESGIIVAEREAGGETVDSDGFSCVKIAKYGKTTVSVFKYNSDGDR